MTPAYFPLTFLPKNEIESINSFVEKFIIYQPSSILTPPFFSEMQKNGLIYLQNPPQNCRNKNEELLKDSLNWINNKFYDKYTNVEFLKVNFGEIPFHKDDTVNSIIKEIKKNKLNNLDFDVKKIMRNLNLFLALAHKNDSDRYGLYLELEKFNINEKKFFSLLSGKLSEKNKINSNGFIQYYNKIISSNFFYLKNRIKAWSSLMLRVNNSPNFLVTNLPFVLKYVTSIIKSKYSFNDNILYFKLILKKNAHNISTEILSDVKKLVFSKNLSKSTLESLNSFTLLNNYFDNDKKLPILSVFPGISLELFLEKLSNIDVLKKNKKYYYNSLNTIILTIN